MNTDKFIDACRKQNLIDLYDVALGYIMDEVPQDDLDKHNLMIMTVDLLADTLFEEKKFSKAESLRMSLKECQPSLYADTIFSLLPDLIYYYLFRKDEKRAAFCLDELAVNPEEDFLLFVHILDVMDAYGHATLVRNCVDKILKSNITIDRRELKILNSYITSIPSRIKDPKLLSIRNNFVETSYKSNIPVITSENIAEGFLDFFALENNNEKKKYIIDEVAFRQYIYRLLDVEFLDTFEYAASVLWGAVYILDIMGSKGILSPEELAYNQDIISKTKAFFLVNIPWDAYWRLRFIHFWNKPWSIEQKEFDSESYIFNHTLPLRPKDILGESILKIFGDKGSDISYYKYLEEEQIAFENSIKKDDIEDFGYEKRKDSMFPYLNYLSGESESEIKPEPSEDL